MIYATIAENQKMNVFAQSQKRAVAVQKVNKIIYKIYDK
jgi:hypothetical protein